MGGPIALIETTESKSLTEKYKTALENMGCDVSVSSKSQKMDDDPYYDTDYFQLLEFQTSKGEKGTYKIAFAQVLDPCGVETPQPWGFRAELTEGKNPFDGENAQYKPQL